MFSSVVCHIPAIFFYFMSQKTRFLEKVIEHKTNIPIFIQLLPENLVSLCLKANAEMVPKIPSCHYMLLMQPSQLKFSSNRFHVLFPCKITTTTG